ncbi:MAG: hypothetical protein NC112_06580 [Oxalobacter formigenes]|nr:hypothetical protein [Oxalobacter formigenes]
MMVFKNCNPECTVSKVAAFSIIAALCLNSSALGQKHEKNHQAGYPAASKMSRSNFDKSERLKNLIEEKKQKNSSKNRISPKSGR